MLPPPCLSGKNPSPPLSPCVDPILVTGTRGKATTIRRVLTLEEHGQGTVGGESSLPSSGAPSSLWPVGQLPGQGP